METGRQVMIVVLAEGIEAFSPTSRNKIMYNVVIYYNGIMEFGSAHGGSPTYNLIGYDLMIDNGMLTWVNTDGTFAIRLTARRG